MAEDAQSDSKLNDYFASRPTKKAAVKTPDNTKVAQTNVSPHPSTNAGLVNLSTEKEKDRAAAAPVQPSWGAANNAKNTKKLSDFPELGGEKQSTAKPVKKAEKSAADSNPYAALKKK
jgi:hypothetical protein